MRTVHTDEGGHKETTFEQAKISFASETFFSRSVSLMASSSPIEFSLSPYHPLPPSLCVCLCVFPCLDHCRFASSCRQSHYTFKNDVSNMTWQLCLLDWPLVPLVSSRHGEQRMEQTEQRKLGDVNEPAERERTTSRDSGYRDNWG